MGSLMRRLAPILVGTVAGAMALAFHAGTGFWYDEAHPARLASLTFPRAMAGATQDIHPIGWIVWAWLAHHLPVPAEFALRGAGCALFGLAAGLLARRSIPCVGAVLLVPGLVETVGLARPHGLLASVGVAIAGVGLETAPILFAALVVGAVATHALGPAVAAGALLGTTGLRLRWRWVAGIGVVSAAMVGGWGFQARAYVAAPWYAPGGVQGWLASLGGWVPATGVVAALLVCRPAERALFVPLALALAAAAGEALGIGMEPGKIAPAILAAAVASLASGRRPALGAAIAAGAFLFSQRTPWDRPDLREAATVVASVPGHVPVVAVWASELNYYHRTPPALPGSTDPADNAERLRRVMGVSAANCVLYVGIPGTAPDGPLDGGTDFLAAARPRGLVVRLYGREGCEVPADPAWERR